MITNRFVIASLMCSALAVAVVPQGAWAKTKPTVVHVMLNGEGGQEMSIKLDTSEIKSGAVEFDIKNEAIGTDHEAVLVKLASKGQKIVVDPKTDRVNESTLKSLGEVADLKAGAEGVLKVKLKPGTYAFICNLKDHVHSGMMTTFTVTN